mmetsp:Transcript_7479/g.20859  ORF Transcript_7479/g.20859 Transcript_7479/m.20859 type:complete len:270 (+) Transcript_7479:1414-2223(+)
MSRSSSDNESTCSRIVHILLNQPRVPKARTAAWKDCSSSSSCRIRASTISLPSISESAFFVMRSTSCSTSTTRRAAVTTSSALSPNSLAEPKNSFATSAMSPTKGTREPAVSSVFTRLMPVATTLVTSRWRSSAASFDPSSTSMASSVGRLGCCLACSRRHTVTADPIIIKKSTAPPTAINMIWVDARAGPVPEPLALEFVGGSNELSAAPGNVILGVGPSVGAAVGPGVRKTNVYDAASIAACVASTSTATAENAGSEACSVAKKLPS